MQVLLLLTPADPPRAAVSNVDILGVEMPQNMRGIFSSWNINTSNWVRDRLLLL